MHPILIATLVATNLLAFLLFGIDKWQARRGGRRIAEVHLLLPALFGGFPGAWLASSTFRHKTVKTSFRLKLLLVTFLNGGWAWLWWKYPLD